LREIIAADVGGTNARFARAMLGDDGVPQLGVIRKYRVADYPSLQACWSAFAREDGGALPDAASIAFATAISGETIKLTNSSWVIRREHLAEDLGLSALSLVNDFGAIAYAVSKLPPESFETLFGPQMPLPRNGSVTILGPGTGLGVALILFENGQPHIAATEGGHLDYAPLDAVESRVLDYLRGKFGRVSTERIVSGPGLNNIYQGLASLSHEKIELLSDADLWQAALEGTQPIARAALERLCLSYGSTAGDLALAHGPHHVVLAGGLTQRMKDYLVNESGFHARFVAKGRFESLMKAVPVSLAVHDEIGLFGAAAAFREE
jgi:glucokinase